MHATVETLPLPATSVPPRTTRIPRLPYFSSWVRWGHAMPSITIIVWTVRLAALINLIAFCQPKAPEFVTWMSGWMPFEISHGRHIRMLLAAIQLLVLSSGLERGKRIAWYLTIGTLAFAPLMHLGRAVIWPQILLNLPLIIVLCVNHRFFVAKTSRRALTSTLIISPLALLAFITIGTMRLHDLRFETSGPDSWLGCFQASCELVLVHHTATQQATTQQALDLFHSLRTVGTSTALLALFLILRPAPVPRTSNEEQAKRMAKLMAEYDEDPLHSYALLGDKIFFFNATKTVAIPYVMSNRYAVTLAGPIGPQIDQPQAIRDFREFCRHQDWVPIFYQVTDESLPLYHALGFASLKIGEDARIETGQFDLKGGRFQNLRTLCHKAEKQGLKFRWYDASEGIDPALENQLAEISNEWLAQKHGNEMSFDMGSFTRDEIRSHGVGVALEPLGRALVFATWRRFGQGDGMVLDLMRGRAEARNVLDFVLVESIKHLHAEGIRDISLGNAPLANATQEYSFKSVEDRAVRFIYENLNHVYAYKPLFEFKRKYRPQWRARHLAYPPGESLPLIGLSLVRVHTKQGRWKFLTG